MFFLPPGKRKFRLSFDKTIPLSRLGALDPAVAQGSVAMIASCALSAIAGALFFAAHRADPAASPGAGILLRILANFLCLAPAFLRRTALPRLRPWRGHRSLWLWGFFGALCTATYYAAIFLVGAGLTLFLNAGSGLFVAALAPLLCGQRAKRVHYLGAAGSFLGLYFLLPPAGAPASAFGAFLALLSGLVGGVALLLVARRRSAYDPATVMLHWGVVNLVCLSGFLFFFPPQWPAGFAPWAYLASAGVVAAAAQSLTAFAYQRAPACLLACLCYLAPVLGTALDASLFRLSLGPRALLGAATVLAFGVAMPLLRERKKAGPLS